MAYVRYARLTSRPNRIQGTMSLRHLQQQLQPRAGFTFWTVENMNGDSVLPTHVNSVPEADTHSNPHGFDTEPPKLPARSGCSRLFLLFLCIGCFTLTAWVVSFAVLLPGMKPVGAPDARKPLPTMLRRFSHLKRVAPGTGTSPQQLQTLFPHWFANGQPSPEVILFDVSLAIAQLTHRVAPVTTSVFPGGMDEENPAHSEQSDL